MVIALEVVWCGIELHLQPGPAVFLPQHNSLVIADPHFGKDASFRSTGIMIPNGTTERDLSRLEMMLQSCGAKRLIILGDFFHNKASRQPETMKTLEDWRGRNHLTEVVNIQGNHDRHAGDPPIEWNIQVEIEPWTFAGTQFRHHPPTDLESGGIYGHLHPSVRLVRAGYSSVVLPCFWLSGRMLAVPAFGGFTGKSRIAPSADDRIFVVTDDHVLEVPTRKRSNK